jgi:hypothetical protein
MYLNIGCFATEWRKKGSQDAKPGTPGKTRQRRKPDLQRATELMVFLADL